MTKTSSKEKQRDSKNQIAWILSRKMARRSINYLLLGYDQSGHIPNANPNDPEVILWSGKQQSNTGCNRTLWSASGFGPGTFGYVKVSRVHGKVSLFEWTLKSDWRIELRTLIRTRRIRTCVGTRGVLTNMCHDGVLGISTSVIGISTQI